MGNEEEPAADKDESLDTKLGTRESTASLLEKFENSEIQEFDRRMGEISSKMREMANFFSSRSERAWAIENSVCAWESARSSLLWRLSVNRKKLSTIYKQGHIVRLLDCTLENLCMIVSSCFPENSVAKFASKLASSFGIIGVISIIYEANASKAIYNDLKTLIQVDHSLFTHIMEYFRNNEEFAIGLNMVDCTNELLEDCFGIKKVCDLRLVKYISIAEILEETELQPQTLFQNLISWTYSSIKDLFMWISFGGPQDIQDTRRFILHTSNSSIRYLVFQSSKSLIPVESRGNSPFVFGCIGMNILCAIDAIRSLWKLDVPKKSKLLQLERCLEMELGLFKTIMKPSKVK